MKFWREKYFVPKTASMSHFSVFIVYKVQNEPKIKKKTPETKKMHYKMFKCSKLLLFLDKTRTKSCP